MSTEKPKQQNPGNRAPAQDRAPRPPDNGRFINGNREQGNTKIDAVFKAPSPPPRPPKGGSK